MITAQNLKEVLQSLSSEELEEVLNQNNQYFGLYITGNYGTVIFEGFEQYSEEDEEEIQSTGGVYGDMDVFFQLCKEAGNTDILRRYA